MTHESLYIDNARFYRGQDIPTEGIQDQEPTPSDCRRSLCSLG